MATVDVYLLADKVNARTAASIDLFNEMIVNEIPIHFVDDSSTVHGKLWCFDDRVVITGSANVSVRGMGSSDGDGLPVRPTSCEDMKWSPDSRAIALQLKLDIRVVPATQRCDRLTKHALVSRTTDGPATGGPRTSTTAANRFRSTDKEGEDGKAVRSRAVSAAAPDSNADASPPDSDLSDYRGRCRPKNAATSVLSSKNVFQLFLSASSAFSNGNCFVKLYCNACELWSYLRLSVQPMKLAPVVSKFSYYVNFRISSYDSRTNA